MSIQFNNNSANIMQEAQKALSDGKITNKELKELKSLVNNSDLSPTAKAGVMKFLEEANKDSKWFFGIFSKTISEKDLGKLRELTQSLPDNQLVKQMDQSLENALKPQNYSDNTSFNCKSSSSYNPETAQFPSFFNNQDSCSVNDYYVTQNGNNLPTGGRDCGPAAASMILKKFGIFDTNQDSRSCIIQTRSAGGNHSSAFSEDNIIDSVQNLSNGQVREIGHKSGFGSDPLKFAEYLQEQINNGFSSVIEIGSPYHQGGTGRHYMVVDSVNSDGSLTVADPGGRGVSVLSPQQLSVLLEKGSDRGNHVISFTRAGE